MISDHITKSWKEVVELCIEQEKKITTINAPFSEKLVIFGAGAQGRIALKYFQQHGIKVRCFTDNDMEKHGTLLDDICVVPPDDPAVLTAPIIVIGSRNNLLPVQRQLEKQRIANLSFDAFFVTTNQSRISFVRNNLLNDDRSRIIYDAILKTMLTGNNFYCASVMEGNQYFALPEFMTFGNDHFVDAGAYVGDTLERFIWINSGIFTKIYAFEPGEPQLRAMKQRVKRLCKEWAILKSAIVCEHAGLADKNKTLAINMSNLLANTSLRNNNCLEDTKQGPNTFCYSLDNYLAGRPATFIKADIEGMELAMLYGAKQTIQRYKPKMALSIYHNPFHLIDIAEYVHSLNPEYHMAVRHHSPIFAESVLYCWVE